MSTQSDELLFWTLASAESTLCESCAMGAVGRFSELAFGQKFENMTEIAIVSEAFVSVAGESMGLTSAPTGRCDNCGVGA